MNEGLLSSRACGSRRRDLQHTFMQISQSLPLLRNDMPAACNNRGLLSSVIAVNEGLLSSRACGSRRRDLRHTFVQISQSLPLLRNDMPAACNNRGLLSSVIAVNEGLLSSGIAVNEGLLSSRACGSRRRDLQHAFMQISQSLPLLRNDMPGDLQHTFMQISQSLPLLRNDMRRACGSRRREMKNGF